MRIGLAIAGASLMLAGCATSQPDLSRGVVPLDQDRWTMRIGENYPSRALRQEQEGSVSLVVTVGTHGRVNRCRITSSSGHAILDDAACMGVTRYARFEPALDSAGQPAEGEWSTTVNYAIN